MGAYAALAHTTYVAGYDMTGDLNATSLNLSRDAQETTVFRPGTATPGRVRIAGLQDVASTVAGFWQAGSDTIDPEAWSGLGSTVQVVTQTPDGVEGSRAYLYQARKFEYQMFGQIGEATPFSLNLQGARGNGTASAGAVPGKLFKAKGTVSAVGATGTGIQLGAVGSGQHLYASFHVFGTPGTTITAVLESDDANTFASATTRITFGPITAAGGTWGTRVAGPVTDTWYRLRVTAITGTFTIACAAGIK